MRQLVIALGFLALLALPGLTAAQDRDAQDRQSGIVSAVFTRNYCISSSLCASHVALPAKTGRPAGNGAPVASFRRIRSSAARCLASSGGA